MESLNTRYDRGWRQVFLLLARLALAGILLAHAIPAIAGDDSAARTGVALLQLPAGAARLAIYVELLCGILLLVGFAVRTAALLVVIHMALGVVVHWREGFRYGADLPFAVLALALVFVAVGGGPWTLQAKLCPRVRPSEPRAS